MSRRYSQTLTCPDCKLPVAATSDGQFRPHARMAKAAGLDDAACVTRSVNPSRRDEHAADRLAVTYQAQTAEAVEQRERQQQDPDTRLPKHLRDG